jgi:hypothetical protein
MAAWIEAWTNCTSSLLSVKKEEGRHSERNLPLDLHAEMAILLSNMALSVFKKVRSI